MLTRPSLVVACMLALARSVHADVPLVLTEQGRLLTPSNAPVVGDVFVTFSLYSVPNGGTPLWSETVAVTLSDGYFAVPLGTASPLSVTLFDGSPRFIGLKVGTDPEMTPRERLSSVPYAFAAADATGDIHPRSISVGGMPVVDVSGNWVGPPTGLSGPAGPAGPTGPSGPPGPRGSTGLSWTGPWSVFAPYHANDVVGHNGSAYVATEDPPTSVEPPSAPWQILVAVGGVGPPGPTGPQGPVGAPGPTGAQGVEGPQGPVGPRGLTWTGPWSAFAPYHVLDAVEHQGSSYIATADPPTSVEPPAAPWQLLATAGVPGPPGASGPQGPVGPRGVTWTGPWSAFAPYVANDVVEHGGSSYIAASNPATGVEPPSAPWQLIAAGGGLGPAGPTGPQGPRGDIGSIGPAGPSGPQGPAGEMGLPGVAGPPGIAGAMDPLVYDPVTQMVSVKSQPSFTGNVTSDVSFSAPALTATNLGRTVNIGDGVRIEGTLGPSPASRLYIADSASDADREGDFIQVYSNDPALPRPVLQLTRLGGLRLWDWLSVAPSIKGPSFWSPANGAMLSVGSDLGPSGVTVAVMNSGYQHDFLAISSYDPGGFDSASRRFTFTDSGMLVFGPKTAASPALRPNGLALETRNGVDSDYAALVAASLYARDSVGARSGLFWADGAPLIARGGAADAEAAVAITLQSEQTYTTSGSRIVSVVNNAAEVANITKEGFVQIGIGNTHPCPPCSESARGTLCYVAGPAGVKDAVQVCAKDAADAFDWRTIY